jgi:hypothetical protein
LKPRSPGTRVDSHAPPLTYRFFVDAPLRNTERRTISMWGEQADDPALKKLGRVRLGGGGGGGFRRGLPKCSSCYRERGDTARGRPPPSDAPVAQLLSTLRWGRGPRPNFLGAQQDHG